MSHHIGSETNYSIPQGPFAAIYADPPWQFRSWSQKGKGQGSDRSPDKHYSVLPLADIKALPVQQIAAENAVLFLWATYPMLQHALETMAAWGFTYKTVAFTWAKQTKHKRWHVGLGYWTRANPEICLLGTRGKPQRLNRDVRNLIISQVREHSRKPDEAYGLIERLVTGPYIELFSRAERPGWTHWGDQTGKFPTEGAANATLGI